MSNETDLDWLARNVHVWPNKTEKRMQITPKGWVWAERIDPEIGREVILAKYEGGFYTKEITEQQWLARRADLRGATERFRPSIEEANRLAQGLKPFTSIEGNQDREGVNQKLNELEMLGKVSHLVSDKRHRITPSKYTKAISGVSVDVYDVLMAWGVTNPALQHLIKKALQCGQRGHKDNEQDLQDIIDSAIRAKELG